MWLMLIVICGLQQLMRHIPKGLSAPFFLIYLTIPLCEAAGNDDTSGPKCPMFEGVNAAFMSWLIAFSAWIAWKKPELAPFIRGTSVRPDPVDPDAPTPRERTALKKWDELNIQLYGAIVSYVSPPIQASLHVTTPDDGVQAIAHLKQRYGAQSTGDRAEAMARVQLSTPEPKSPKLTLQNNTTRCPWPSQMFNPLVARPLMTHC